MPDNVVPGANPPKGLIEPNPSTTDAIGRIEAGINQKHLQAIQKALTALETRSLPPPTPSPPPFVSEAPVLSAAVTPAPHEHFEAMFFRDVGFCSRKLQARTEQLLAGEPVVLTDADKAQLMTVLNPYLAAGRQTAAAAQWMRTKLNVWIEAGVGVGDHRSRSGSERKI
jgi:hypothetical protein